jgi:hypothetical protein
MPVNKMPKGYEIPYATYGLKNLKYREQTINSFRAINWPDPFPEPPVKKKLTIGERSSPNSRHQSLLIAPAAPIRSVYDVARF